MQNHAQNHLAIIAEVQEECRAESPKVARAILCAWFPHRTDSFFKRNLPMILALSPDDFLKMVGHPDPTGETAVRNVMAVGA